MSSANNNTNTNTNIVTGDEINFIDPTPSVINTGPNALEQIFSTPPVSPSSSRRKVCPNAPSKKKK